MKSFLILSPAKINLWLKITGKREDGYHLLNSLVQKISLFDVIKIVQSGENEGKITFFSEWEIGDNNSIKKAIEAFSELTGKSPNFNIYIRKNIPVGSGLGGGSSNAAIVLKFLNWYYGNILNYNALLKLGVTIGADVPLFISNKKRLLMKGVGDILSSPDIELSNYWILLIKPEFSISIVVPF